MYKAVIFDLDGTLLNTLTDLASSVNYALRFCGYPERSVEEVRGFIGNGVIKLMSRSVPEKTDKVNFEKCFSVFKAHYLEHMYDTTEPYEGVGELLEKLKGLGVGTAVVSNKLHSGVVGLCNDFFENKLTCAFGVENESERKPSPKNVLRTMDFLDVSPNETIYVGDSEVDVETARNAGLSCIGVTWGFRDEAELISAGAEYIVSRPEQIIDIVTQNR